MAARNNIKQLSKPVDFGKSKINDGQVPKLHRSQVWRLAIKAPLGNSNEHSAQGNIRIAIASNRKPIWLKTIDLEFQAPLLRLNELSATGRKRTLLVSPHERTPTP
jgi:hypothetical protein